MKIEDEIKQDRFPNALSKAILNILLTADRISSATNATLKPFGISKEQYNVLRICRTAVRNRFVVGRRNEPDRDFCYPGIGDRLVIIRRCCLGTAGLGYPSGPAGRTLHLQRRGHCFAYFTWRGWWYERATSMARGWAARFARSADGVDHFGALP